MRSKQEDLKILYEISDMVLDVAYNFEKAAFIGDVTLVDTKSGTILETCFINSKVRMIWLFPKKNMGDYFEDIAFTMAKLTNESEMIFRDDLAVSVFLIFVITIRICVGKR